MSNQTISIIDKATSTCKPPYNIITFDTHERYQIQLAKTGHNFYSFRYDGCKEWVDSYGKRPHNHYTLPKNSLVNGIEFDFILSQSRFGQHQTSVAIANHTKLPIIALEHTLPIPQYGEQRIQQMREMRGDINVFISEYSAGAWGIFGRQEIVHHSVDTNLFHPRGVGERIDNVLSVANDFKNRDYCLNYYGWERITKGLPVTLVGDNPGLSKPSSSPEELADIYASHKIFLNTSIISPIPTSLLEAMACGCAVVSTATCMIPEIIQNGVNGFISNDEGELRKYIEILHADKDLCERLGQAARETIIAKFSEERFITQWNRIFDMAYGVKK